MRYYHLPICGLELLFLDEPSVSVMITLSGAFLFAFSGNSNAVLKGLQQRTDVVKRYLQTCLSMCMRLLMLSEMLLCLLPVLKTHSNKCTPSFLAEAYESPECSNTTVIAISFISFNTICKIDFAFLAFV